MFTYLTASKTSNFFLSPYSPDFSPIELGWSKIKECLRTQAARSYPALDEAITAAIDALAIAPNGSRLSSYPLI